MIPLLASPNHVRRRMTTPFGNMVSIAVTLLLVITLSLSVCCKLLFHGSNVWQEHYHRQQQQPQLNDIQPTPYPNAFRIHFDTNITRTRRHFNPNNHANETTNSAFSSKQQPGTIPRHEVEQQLFRLYITMFLFTHNVSIILPEPTNANASTTRAKHANCIFYPREYTESWKNNPTAQYYREYWQMMMFNTVVWTFQDWERLLPIGHDEPIRPIKVLFTMFIRDMMPMNSSLIIQPRMSKTKEDLCDHCGRPSQQHVWICGIGVAKANHPRCRMMMMMMTMCTTSFTRQEKSVMGPWTMEPRSYLRFPAKPRVCKTFILIQPV